MPLFYMTHPVYGGVHIAYEEDEVKRCEADGWVNHGDKHPAEGGKPQPKLPPIERQPADEFRMPDEPAQPPKKRGPGRPRKGK